MATDEKERLVSCPETNKLQPRRRLQAHSSTVVAECKKWGRGAGGRGQVTGCKLQVASCKWQVAGGRWQSTCNLVMSHGFRNFQTTRFSCRTPHFARVLSNESLVSGGNSSLKSSKTSPSERVATAY